MDDLAGLDWTSASSQASKPPTGASYPSLRPSPTPSLPSLSGRSTPLSNQPSGLNPSRKIGSKPSTPANDSFSGLLSLGGSKPKAAGDGLSLQERQRQLLEEKAKQNGFGANANAWETLGGSGKTTPEPRTAQVKSPDGMGGMSQATSARFAAYNARTIPATEENEEDILAAFNSSAPVDASSHFPVPNATGSGRNTPGFASEPPPSRTDLGDDDDPFGLNQMASKPPAQTAPQPTTNDDDFDILGDLAKPVSELPPKPAYQPEKKPAAPPVEDDSSDDDIPSDPRDKAVAELVDMGFSVGQAVQALEHTNDGTDIQAAVGWLLNQAHNESKAKTERSRPSGRDSNTGSQAQSRDQTPRGREGHADAAMPAWMRNQDDRPRSNSRRDGQSPAAEKDVTQYAQEIGNTLFKSANSLWKTGRKQVQKAVSDFQQDGDSSQPKWMREAHAQDERASASMGKARKQENITDEAMMLEAGSGRPQTSRSTSRTQRQDMEAPLPRRPQVPLQEPKIQQSRPPGRLTREDIEEQSSQAYISPARRKKATPQPVPEITPALSRPATQSPGPSSESLPSKNPFATRPSPQLRPTPPPQAARAPSKPSTPLPTRPKAPTRNIPHCEPTSLSTSSKQRKLGSEAFKRGDYHAAHELYSRALAPLPQNHPVAIVVLTNRALTGLKNGDPKSCIADADLAMAIVGVSRGENETIDLGVGEGKKAMTEFWGKAIMRKAEALEAMEKWSDAAKIWREAVEAGVGGSIAIQGRNRSEKAAGQGAASQVAAKPTPKPQARRPPPRPAVNNQKSAEAVRKMREANAAAEKADDEKFALTDQVDAKLIAWKGTKSDNLRALLGSLDAVLWPEAGWKKVGMAELVMPNKVKIIYMKAIAKVHPDKISQTATTEQKMISASVFSTLNEAWDKFKTDNNL